MYPRNAIRFQILSCIVALILVGGCSKSPKNFAPRIDPATAGKAAIEQYDADYNSRISGKELEQAASLNSNLEKIDLNNDKALSADEIAQRIRYWQNTKQLWSRTPILCMVFHNKELLADAEVKLVPEKFLGEGVKPAKGKTSFNGVAVLYADNPDPGDPPGVGPGFYKVEITKPGEPIPAKYNTNTILGLDTSMDNPAMYKGVRFVLEYEQPKKKK
jgi:hypothetical protein